MVNTEVSKNNLADKIIQIAEMCEAQIDKENLEKMRTFLKQEKTPFGHVYMGNIVKLNYIGEILDKITLERPYQIRDAHDNLTTLIETYRVYSRKRN